MKQEGAASIPLSQARLTGWCPGLLLFALVFFFYLPAMRGGFVWDDGDHITENPCIIGPLGLAEIWTSAKASICPMVLTTFWMEYHLWLLNPLPYHVVNILMHAAAALVLWRVLVRLNIPGAWLGAALWALHPVQVESVAWITEMKNTQSGFFFLLAILFFCRWKEAPLARDGEKRARVYYALVLICGFLAMASKSSTVVLPLALALCAWWMDGRWQWRRHLPLLVPLLAMSAAAGVMSMWTQGVEGTGLTPNWALSGLQRVAVAGRAVWFYLGKLLWPHPLMVTYPRWEIPTSGGFVLLPAVAAMALTVVIWIGRNQWNRWGRGLWLAWAFFLLALSPVLGLVDHSLLRFSFVFDHFQYLASMGPLALVGAGIHAGLNAFKQSAARAIRVSCSLVLLLLGVLTWRQCGIYRSDEVLWTATLSSNPFCWAAHSDLGTILGGRGQLDDAMEHFRKAIEINPYSAEDHHNIGLVLQRKGQLEAAIAEFRKALQLKPEYAQAHNNLGAALGRQGQAGEALEHFQRAVDITPGFAEAHNNLGRAFQGVGRLDDAIPQYRKALEVHPDFAEAHHSLGLALEEKGQVDEALEHYQKAIELKPDYAEAHNSVGVVFGKKGQPGEAVKHFQKAVEIRPDFAEAHNNLGIALRDKARSDVGSAKPTAAQVEFGLGIERHQKGDLDEAVQHFQRALEIDFGYAEAHNYLAIVLAKKGRADEALTHFQRAIDINPGYSEAQHNLGFALQKMGRPQDAVAHYEKAIEINPDYATALRSLAFLLATTEQASLRDGARAVELAQRASKLSGGGNPMAQGTLAAAQAEAGHFPEAVAAVQEAIRLAEAQNLTGMAEMLKKHLELYQRGQALRSGP